MGHPEKDRNNDANFEGRKDPPPLDAVLPNVQPPDREDIFKEMDDFQKKLASEWETAKGAYEQKIDQIMTDFIQLKEKEIPVESSPKTSMNPQGKPNSPAPEEEKTTSPQATPVTPMKDPAVDNMFDDVKKALRRIEKKSRHLSDMSFDKPSVINLRSYSYLPWYRRLLPWIAGFMLMGGVSYAVWFFLIAIPPVTKLPYSHTTGMLVNHSGLRTVDWFRKALYVHATKRGFPIESVENLPNPFVAGLCLTNKSLFSLDGMNQKILEHSLTPDHRVLNDFSFPDRKLVGLFWDETDLWAFDNKEKLLLQFQKTDFGEIKNQYAGPQIDLTAFQVINNRVWILSGSTRELLLFRLQNPLRLLYSYDLDLFVPKGSPTGFSVFKKNVYVLTDDPATLNKIPLQKIDKYPSKS